MTIKRMNLIGRLLEEKFPEYFAFLQQQKNNELILTVVEPPIEEEKLFEKALESHRELIGMSDEQLEKSDIQRKIRSIVKKDASHPLNAFPYEARENDFEFYARAAVWEIQEAAALFVGRNPKTFNVAAIKRFKITPSSADRYKSILELLERACSIRQLNRADFPGRFLGWAESVNIDVPAELKQLVLKHNHQIVFPPNLYPKSELNRRDVGGETGNAFTKSASETTDKDLKQRERTSLLKLIVGMAIGGYAYDPHAKRSEAVPDIRNDLERVGLPLDEQTIRRYLKEGVEMLPRDNDKAN